MRRLAAVVDDYALRWLPNLDTDLARSGVLVLRAFDRLPGPAMLRRHPECHGVAVVGGPDFTQLRARLELATATLAAPVVAVLPPGLAPREELRGPGVVDLLPAGTPHAAERVRLMANVPIVSAGGRRSAGPVEAVASAAPRCSGRGAPPLVGARPEVVVAVASSTGGAWVVAELLQAYHQRAEAAVLLAQHMDAEFVDFFASWLSSMSPWPAVVVADTEPLLAGRLYLAAGGRDLVAEANRVVALPAASRFIPCADRLLASVAEAHRSRARAVVLSGMGADGAEGLAAIQRQGGRAICQVPSTAAVPSMPECALRRCPGAEVAPPAALAAVLARV